VICNDEDTDGRARVIRPLIVNNFIYIYIECLDVRHVVGSDVSGRQIVRFIDAAVLIMQH